MPYVTSFPSPGHVHATTLAEMSRSPLHYKHAVDHGRKDTPALLFGRVVHAMLLGFGSFVVWDGGSKSSNVYKAFKAEHADDDIIDTDTEARARAVAESIRKTPRAIELLTGCTLEREVEWEINGRKCAGRFDAYRTIGEPCLVDVKTAVSAKESKFIHQGRSLGYPAKLAWYRAGGVAAGLFKPDIPCYLIAAEKAAPNPCTVFRLTDRALLEGEKQWRAWFERLQVCEHTNTWPGYTDAIVDFDVPDEAQEIDFSGLDNDEEAA